MKQIIRTVDMIGQTYNNLEVKSISHKDEKHKYYLLCECTLCGEQKVILATHVKFGKIKSCGCLRKELAAERQMKVHFEDYEKIWERYKNGETAINMAKSYGVSRQAITNILSKMRRGENK